MLSRSIGKCNNTHIENKTQNRDRSLIFLDKVIKVVSLSGVQMKSVVRWGAVISVFGSLLLGPSLTGTSKALALSQEQIIEKLQSVLVFTITNQEGTPLIASISNDNQGEEASVASFFISERDATAFVQQIEGQNPTLGQTARVVPVPLGKVYQLEQANANSPQALEFAFIPVQQQVQFAAQELENDGQQVPRGENGMPLFNGVPLFYATVGPQHGYLTVEQNGQQMIPIFFNREQLDAMLEKVRQQQPDLASDIDVKVSNLEKVIEELENNDDPTVSNIVLVPPVETVEYLRTQQQQQPQSGGGQQ